MAEEANTTSTGTTPPAPPETPPEPEEKTVPYDRFAEVNKQAKEASKELKDLRERLQEIEDRDKSELERERAQRERLTQELQDRETRLVQVERGSWVRAAAQAAKFVDPEDAVALVDLSQIESEKDAERAVKKVADRKDHLIQKESPSPGIGRVLEGGQSVGASSGQSPQDEANEQFLSELKARSQDGWQSVPGLLDQ